MIQAFADEQIKVVQGITITCPAYTMAEIVSADGQVMRPEKSYPAEEHFVPVQMLFDLAHVGPWEEPFIDLPWRVANLLAEEGIAGHHYGKFSDERKNHPLRDFVCAYYPEFACEFAD